MGLSYLPQEPSVFRKLTVEDNVKAIFEHIGVGGQGDKRAHLGAP